MGNSRSPMIHRMKYARYVFLATLLSGIEHCLAQSCTVDSFSVKDNFDPKRYAGKWYALAKKDPEGLFLQDNISAEYTIEEDGTMIASSKGRVKLFGFWVICADMAAQYTVPDPTTPAKMYMSYQGLASYLSSGGDNYWVIDTDYDNYAITYACRSLKEDGTCDDGYSLIFSRNPRGLPLAIQRIVRQKQEEICMSGQFQPVLQTDSLQFVHISPNVWCPKPDTVLQLRPHQCRTTFDLHSGTDVLSGRTENGKPNRNYQDGYWPFSVISNGKKGSHPDKQETAHQNQTEEELFLHH
ncbi:sulfate anion transporter 1 isoform X2 [Gopherus flavomarginatus]|uniref:sulfate anion transporter 1 isoform X2 n=1 Tax=Gopherus flavomarginatus TaxID=286002 RepID=UPI0021CBCCC5|nr:sulfate anion transporter 1 isoform X2 [Gopherus flavomarginatus]